MAEEKNIDPLVFMQQELCDMWGINNQTKYVFYYDESNNCRKFWVDDSKQQFNTDHTADFVLAGLVRKEEEKVEASLETFRKPLKLQANVEEIKFKNLYAKGDFLQCVKERRLFETLSWIDKSPFYIHYTNVNNLFYTLVEIFDSIVKPDEISEFGYDYFKMKSVFYYRNLLGGLYRENPVKSRNYEAVKSSKKWENVGNSYIIPALLLYRYSYI